MLFHLCYWPKNRCSHPAALRDDGLPANPVRSMHELSGHGLSTEGGRGSQPPLARGADGPARGEP
eukprot:6167052-Alexandrium_andersonii.AAC.1